MHRQMVSPIEMHHSLSVDFVYKVLICRKLYLQQSHNHSGIRNTLSQVTLFCNTEGWAQHAPWGNLSRSLSLSLTLLPLLSVRSEIKEYKKKWWTSCWSMSCCDFWVNSFKQVCPGCCISFYCHDYLYHMSPQGHCTTILITNKSFLILRPSLCIRKKLI